MIPGKHIAMGIVRAWLFRWALVAVFVVVGFLLGMAIAAIGGCAPSRTPVPYDAGPPECVWELRGGCVFVYYPCPDGIPVSDQPPSCHCALHQGAGDAGTHTECMDGGP